MQSVFIRGILTNDASRCITPFATGQSRYKDFVICLSNRPERFIEVASKIPATAPYVDGRSAPITDVFVMARLLNRSRRFTDADGAPKVLGFSAVGDSHTCTNPLYGRGCSLGFVQAELLAASLADWPNDRMSPLFVAAAEAVEEAVLNALTMATTVTGRDGIEG